MTTEELKRAFDICLDTHGCTDCPLLKLERQNGCSCKHNLFVSAIDLVTEQEKEIAQLKDENVRLRGKLAQVLLSINTVKEMNAMCNIDDQRKQAVKEFAEKLKGKLQDFGDGGEKGAYITEKDIDEFITEAEGINNDH